MQGIVGREVQSTALLALQCPAGDEVADIDHVTELADVTTCLHTLEETLRLLIEHVETVP